MSDHTDEQDNGAARAFGQGSDARLAGQPLTMNPYPVGHPLRYWFAHGWKHTDKYQGVDAKVPCTLPPVRYGATA